LPKSAKESNKSDMLRAAIQRPTRDGMIYAMTAPGQLFRFDPEKQTIKNLGPNFLTGSYTAAMAISPDDRFLYFVPGAHGGAARVSVPIVQYEIATGKRKVLAFLTDVLRDKLDYHTGGTYNVQMSNDGQTLFVTFNGAAVVSEGERQRAFGLTSVMAVHIPAQER